MRLFLNPTKDATIYQKLDDFNTGLDEILELGKLLNTYDTVVAYASASVRILLDFDIENNQAYPEDARYYLNLHLAHANDVHRYQEVLVYPVSRSWVEGSGYRYQDVKNVEDGATWNEYSAGQAWSTPGADYILTPSASVLLSEYPLSDVRIDVTDIIAPIVNGSGSFDWNGLLLKYPATSEQSTVNKSNIKFFSSNTHTVYSPRLEIVWNELTFVTGSLKPIPENQHVAIFPKNLKEAYSRGEVDRVYLVVRDKYPDKKYETVERYRNVYYLPSGSTFRIKDQVSGLVIQDFDQYSPIQCDASGSYFMLDVSHVPVNRYYDIDLRVVSGDLVRYPPFLYTFKVDKHD